MKYLILIPSLLILLSGCTKSNDTNVQKHAFEDLRAEIRIVISDSERQVEALRIIDQLNDELLLLSEKKAKRVIKSETLNANYDTTRAEFDAFLLERNRELRLSQQRILDKRIALIAITTTEEWEQIFDVRSESIEAAILAVKSN